MDKTQQVAMGEQDKSANQKTPNEANPQHPHRYNARKKTKQKNLRDRYRAHNITEAARVHRNTQTSALVGVSIGMGQLRGS